MLDEVYLSNIRNLKKTNQTRTRFHPIYSWFLFVHEATIKPTDIKKGNTERREKCEETLYSNNEQPVDFTQALIKAKAV